MQSTARATACWLLGAWLAGCAVVPGELRPSEPARAVEEAPAHKRARLRLELATAYYQQGQDAVALEELRQSLAHRSDLAAAWNLQGLVLMRQGQWVPARESLERGLSLAPQDADLAHNLGWLLCQQPEPRLEQAEQLFQRALAMAGSARTWTALGLCQQRADQLERAQASLERALAWAPDQALALWPLAQVLYRQGRWQQAWDTLAQLHARQAASAESLWLAIRAAHKLDNGELAREATVQLRQQHGRSPQAQALDKGWFDE